MPTNGQDNLELVVLPPNALGIRTSRENNNNLVFDVWDNFLNSMFYNATMGYATFPRSLRRLIELIFLLKAVLSLVVLIYVHMSFSRMPAHCLDHIKDVWPRDGILRVEIIRRFQHSHAEQIDTINELFTVEKSYEREYKLKRMDTNEEKTTIFNSFTKTNSPENRGVVDIEPSTEELVDNKFQETNTPKPNLSFTNYIDFEGEKIKMFSRTTKTNRHTTSKSNFSTVEDSEQFYSTKYQNSSIRGVLGINSLLHSTSTKLPLINDHEEIFYENYIVEYSLEGGYLNLPPSARNRLHIPVMLVGLKCMRNKYFGDSVDQFFFEHFLGYKDLLFSSVTSLSENKGFMRNANTGEYTKFWNISIPRKSCISSFFIMVMFTVSISIILRNSHNQLFNLIVNLMHQISVQGSISVSVAPFLTFILALIGE
ncbi:hypothetical protein QTP88_001606 [Uroleucon formosanum]